MGESEISRILKFSAFLENELAPKAAGLEKGFHGKDLDVNTANPALHFLCCQGYDTAARINIESNCKLDYRAENN